MFLACLLACLVKGPRNFVRAFLVTPRSTANRHYCFHPSYRKLTAFLYILFIILVTLPASHAVTCAIVPYYPHRQNGLSTMHHALSPLLHHFVSAASGHGIHRQYHFEPSPHFVQTPRQIFLRKMRLPVRLLARSGCARSALFLSIGVFALSIHRCDVNSDNRISPDRLS